ncbi:MAG: nucleotide sugar dehydrogenase, partial [Bradyrhizobium sp.]
MRIAMIGSGYVGLVSGACFAQFGHDVVCVDKETSKIERLRNGEIPIFEPGLDKLVADNARSGRLTFSTQLGDAVGNADAVFIAVGTPTRRGDGHADLSYVYAAAAEIAQAIRGYTVVVTKSTVPVGTSAKVREALKARLAERGVDLPFDVVSNPEFLKEGAAVEDFMRPDRIIVGTDNARPLEFMRTLYAPFNR